MDFRTSITLTATELRTSPIGDGVVDQTALLLIGHAARHLAAQNPAWSFVTLDVLDVAAELYPNPDPIVLEVDPPGGDDTASRQAVDELLRAFADRCDRASTLVPDTSRALTLSTAAIRLRQAAVHLR
ncbi:hypothetical protein AB0B10_25695 [Micromonospora arborensis]|uniref:hypothetical protein n=1 Tax=Micromonospora arborensis TaxID=2116518 RepID=UPI0033C8356D